MAEKDQFFSFEEALKELRLKEEELKRLVSEGEIRAFREGETMKLRRADVESLRSELSGGDVVDLGEVKEELVFEDDALSDAGMATQEIGLATEEIEGVETVLEEPIETIQASADDTIVDEEAAAAMAGAGAGAAVARRNIAIVEEVPEEYEGAGMRAIVLVTTLVMILTIPLVLAVSTNTFAGVSASLAGLFGK